MRLPLRSTVAAGIVSVAAVAAVLTPASGALATQGQPIIAGQLNTETTETLVHNTSQIAACEGQGSGFTGSGLTACGEIGLIGRGTGLGVFGSVGDDSAAAIGVFGMSTSVGGLGVRGYHADDGAGVSGQAEDGGTGVEGEAGAGGTGVFGFNSGTTGIGVHGVTDGVGSAVYGHARGSGVGINGETAAGIAVRATAAGTGTALQVLGKATFSRSGRVTIPAGTSAKTISMARVTTASMVFATAQQNANVFVKAVIPAGGSFTIRLTGNAPAGGLKVAYFVLN